jgi:hypothetical protein
MPRLGRGDLQAYRSSGKPQALPSQLWYYILDTCLVNSYLISKGKSKDQGRRAHREFREALSLKLRNTLYSEAEKTTDKRCYSSRMPAVNQEALAHNLTRLEGCKYCV